MLEKNKYESVSDNVKKFKEHRLGIKERVNKIIVSLKDVSTEISGITDEVLRENIVIKELKLSILSKLQAAVCPIKCYECSTPLNSDTI